MLMPTPFSAQVKTLEVLGMVRSRVYVF
jgi:hypothetical protein